MSELRWRHVAVCLPDGTDGAGHRLSLFIGVGHAHRGDLAMLEIRFADVGLHDITNPKRAIGDIGRAVSIEIKLIIGILL